MVFQRKISVVSPADGRPALHDPLARRKLGSDASPLKSGLRALRPAVKSVVVFSMFMNLLLFVSPLYMLQIYDRVMSSRSIATLISITVIAGVLLAVYGLLEAARTRILVRAGFLFDEQVAQPAFNAIHLAMLRRPDSGQVQALRDVDTLREFLSGAGLLAICDVPWFPVFILGAFLLHPWYGVIAIVGGAVIWGLTLLNEILTRRDLTEASSASIAASQRATTTFRNVEVLQAMGMLGALRAIWSGIHLRHMGWQARASDRAAALMASTKFFRTFLQVIVLGTGGYLAIQREITPGAIIAGSIIIGRALQPMELAVGHWKGFVSARGAYRRLKALFDLADASTSKMSLPRPNGAVSVEGVIAGAPGQREAILRGVTFSLPAGEALSIVGPSGAGKTTLARVLVGIWPIVAGDVRLDGYHLPQWDPQKLGRYIGYLPQDVELFSGTIVQNISRFQDDVEPADVIAAAELAGCHEMIQHMPEGYNTQIGEGGQALSGGQRQRLALARALYGSPSLVVLDEPNSNLDSSGEEALTAAIQHLKARGTTVVLITHKLNILTTADKILVMSAGSVQGYGPRDTILGQLMGPRVVSSTTDAPAAGPPALGGAVVAAAIPSSVPSRLAPHLATGPVR
jgi:ATP-binding cassette, subfamily C, bacterial